MYTSYLMKHWCTLYTWWNIDAHFILDEISMHTLYLMKYWCTLYTLYYSCTQSFTSDYLQPYKSDSCTNYSTCRGCLTDAACGWCPLSDTCELRDGPTLSMGRCGTSNRPIEHYLVLDEGNCGNCSQHWNCDLCTTVSLFYFDWRFAICCCNHYYHLWKCNSSVVEHSGHVTWRPWVLEKFDNNDDNNNKNGAHKVLTTEVSKRFNKQSTMINNYILNKTKRKCK